MVIPAFMKLFVYRCTHEIMRLRVDGRPKRLIKCAFTNDSGYVWTGSRYSHLTL